MLAQANHAVSSGDSDIPSLECLIAGQARSSEITPEESRTQEQSTPNYSHVRREIYPEEGPIQYIPDQMLPAKPPNCTPYHTIG